MLKADRAHSAWPMQWYYAYGLASIAAAAGEPSTTARALDDLAALGVGVAFPEDTTLADCARRNITVATSSSASRRTARRSRAACRTPSFRWRTPRSIPRASRSTRRAGASRRRHPRAPDRRGLDVEAAGRARLREHGRLRGAGGRGRREARPALGDERRLPQAGEIAASDTGRAALQAFDLATGKEVARHELPRAPGATRPATSWSRRTATFMSATARTPRSIA